MTAKRAAANPRAGKALRAVLDHFDQAREVDAFLEVDTRFHLTIAEQSLNAVAALFMEALREAMAREMLSRFQSLDDWAAVRQLLITEHREIATHIETGDGQGAAAAMARHIRDFYARPFP
jgi:GntR family transcriptional repressor for pyruvate dehydrogenase complex